MRFLIDAQLPVALSAWLVGGGHQAEHVAQVGLLTATDQAIWDAALRTGSVVITKDHDFVEWVMTRRPAPPVLWLRMGNVSNDALIARLDAVWETILGSLEAGALVVEAGR